MFLWKSNKKSIRFLAFLTKIELNATIFFLMLTKNIKSDIFVNGCNNFVINLHKIVLTIDKR